MSNSYSKRLLVARMGLPFRQPADQGWHVFLQSPGKWAGFPCQDKVVQMAESR